MSDIAIRVDGLSKLYQLGATERYRTLRETLIDTFLAPFRRLRRGAGPQEEAETLWALKDVSFEVKQGEVIGIIGRNGAGKSTLFKVLSRITEPTHGHAEIRGRVGSLLEVGTGFHPELSGRENIFLNGAILSMKKAEILRKFDEIVAFAEVEKFIDTPVKHYSSGMYLRLAFAVAAHMETDILIVDEVLAVGDAAFQKKCLGKMGDVAAGGRTVLLVSHNMNAIQRLCDRAVLLDSGRIAHQGSVVECVKRYLRSEPIGAGGRIDLSCSPGIKRRGTGAARFEYAELLSVDGEAISTLQFGQSVRIRLTVRAERILPDVLIGFSFVANDGTELQGSSARDGGVPGALREGSQVLECWVDPMLLTPGRYFLRAAIFSHTEIYEHLDEFLPFEVAPYGDIRDGRLPSGHYVGYVYQPYAWSEVKEIDVDRATLQLNSRS